MKIAYIILTCEKNYYTRIQWINIISEHKSSIYYLAHTMDIPNQLYSWGATDLPSGLIFKLIDAFKHLELDYDWYVIMEDDTFVFHERLYSLLSTYPNNNIAIGYNYSIPAGIVLSHKSYITLQNYIRTSHISLLISDLCPSKSIQSWINTCGIEFIHHTGFHIYFPKQFHLDAITYHGLKKWDDYAEIEKIL